MAKKEAESSEEGKAEEALEAKVEAPEADDVQKELAEMKDRMLRLAAEFDNYKKRTAKDIDSSKMMGRADAIAKLLPTVDEFELAMNWFSKDDEHMKGIALIYSNLMSTLKGLGLREIDSAGKFDPYRHEIVLTRASDKADGAIVEVVRKGYMLNDIMLRPASVIVSKAEAKAEGKNE